MTKTTDSAFHRLHRSLLVEHEREVKALRKELQELKTSNGSDEEEAESNCSVSAPPEEPKSKRSSVMRPGTPPSSQKRASKLALNRPSPSSRQIDSPRIVCDTGPSLETAVSNVSGTQGAAVATSAAGIQKRPDAFCTAPSDLAETCSISEESLDAYAAEKVDSRPDSLPIKQGVRSFTASSNGITPVTQAWTSITPAPPAVMQDASEIAEPMSMPALLGTVTAIGESDDNGMVHHSSAKNTNSRLSVEGDALRHLSPKSSLSRLSISSDPLKPSPSSQYPQMTAALRKLMNDEEVQPEKLELLSASNEPHNNKGWSRAFTMPLPNHNVDEQDESSNVDALIRGSICDNANGAAQRKRTLPSLPALKTTTNGLRKQGSILKKVSAFDGGAADADSRVSKKRGVSFDHNSIVKAEDQLAKRNTMELEQEKYEPRLWWHASVLEMLPVRNGPAVCQRSQQASKGFREINASAIRVSMVGQAKEYQVANPNALHHFFWDILAILVVGLDVLIIPMKVFESGANVAGEWLLWFTTIFWTLDFFHNFCVGYYEHGEVVLSMRRVIKRYALSWMCTDLLTNIVDWIRIISGNVGNKGTSVDDKLYGIHCIRLLRLLKLKRLMKMLEDRITSEYTSNAITICKLFSSLIMLTHVIGCTWYWIGRESQAEGVDSWIEYLDGAELRYKYTTSFHWSLTQFTPASITVQPHNFYERAFAVVVLLCALIVFSSFVSGITGAMMHIRSLQSVKSKQFWLLRRYLNESKVPVPLAIRVQQYVENAYESREVFLKEASVEVLSLLSAQLHRELQTAIYEPRISTHPFMVLISKLDENTIQEVCSKALTRCSLVRGETLFSVAEAAKKMHFVCMGNLLYEFIRGDMHKGELRTAHKDHLRENMWVCESVLWTTWTYFGSLTSVTECEVVCVDSELFGTALKLNREVWQEGFNYARSFVQGLNRVGYDHLSDMYVSNLIEGLYFRLFNEFNCKRLNASSVAASTDIRNSGTFGFGGLGGAFGKYERPMLKFINRITNGGRISDGDRNSVNSSVSSCISEEFMACRSSDDI